MALVTSFTQGNPSSALLIESGNYVHAGLFFLTLWGRTKMGRFKPGESVPRSGVYRVYHDLHRLMHEAALLNGELFPCCRQCNNSVRFELFRLMHDANVLPFSL